MRDFFRDNFMKFCKFTGIKDFYILELPKIIERPSGSRILVFLPHPDDDAIGCGGSLIKLFEANAKIWSVNLTDG